MPYTSRPDICIRVFYANYQELIKDLTDRQIFGAVEAYENVVEFQKRGLPHVHMLIFLKQEEKIFDGQKLDKLIWAELPNIEKHSDLYHLVVENMIYRCDEGCLDERRICRRKYLKPTSDAIVMIENGYTRYQRSPFGALIARGSITNRESSSVQYIFINEIWISY